MRLHHDSYLLGNTSIFSCECFSWGCFICFGKQSTWECFFLCPLLVLAAAAVWSVMIVDNNVYRYCMHK